MTQFELLPTAVRIAKRHRPNFDGKAIMKRARAVASSMLAIVSVGCVAPETPVQNAPEFQQLTPDSGDLDATALVEGIYRYQNNAGNQMNIRLSREPFEGREAFRAEVWFNAALDDGSPDLIRFDASTYRFLSRRMGDPARYVVDVRFTDDNRFVGTLTPGEDSGYTAVVYDRPYPHGGFEPSILFFYLSALPLHEAYTVSIPTFDLNNGSQMIWANIEVEEREQINVLGRSYDALRIVSRGARNKIFWIVDDMPVPIRMRTGDSPAWTLVTVSSD